MKLPVGKCKHCGKQVWMEVKDMSNNKPFEYCEACRARPELFGFEPALDNLPPSIRKAFMKGVKGEARTLS